MPSTALLVFTHVPDAHLGRDALAEAQLEEQLEPRRLGLRRLGKPASQLLPAELGELISIAPPPARLALAGAGDQPLLLEPPQDRVDLAVALVPEVPEVALDVHLHRVAGLEAHAEHAEHGVARAGEGVVSWGRALTIGLLAAEISLHNISG